MNPLVPMFVSGLVGQTISRLKVDKLVGMVVENIANGDNEEAVTNMAMTFVQPVVDKVEELIKSNEMIEELKPILAMVFSVLSKVFGNIALDLSDVKPD